MHNVIIGAEVEISIGANSQIAEACGLRDANHGVDVSGLISQAPMVARPLRIGSNVWIGRGTTVLAGADISDGAVIGANSVVRTRIPADSIAVGAPAKVIRMRKIELAVLMDPSLKSDRHAEFVPAISGERMNSGSRAHPRSAFRQKASD